MIEQTAGRLRELRAILDTIEAAELLGHLPTAPSARARHQAAVSLLAVLHRELCATIDDLDCAAVPSADMSSRNLNG